MTTRTSIAALSKRSLLAITVVCAVLRLPVFLRPIFDADEGQYAAIAQLMRAGGTLYGDGGVDFKPPGIYWTYASVFDVFGGYAMWAVHLLTILVVIATAWLVAAIAARLDRRAGTLAGVLYGVFTAVDYPKMLAANTEVFMMLPLAGAVLLALVARDARRWWVHLAAAGALVVVASGFKQSAPINLAVLAVAVLGTRRPLARLAMVAVGFAAALGLGALAVVATTSWSAMWYWCVTQVSGKYGAAAWHGALLEKIVIGFGCFFGSSLLLWIAAGRAVLRVRSASREALVVWTWLAVSLASAIAGGHFFGHYFIQTVPAFAVIAAVELAGGFLRRAAPWLIALPALAFFVNNIIYEPNTERFGAPSPDFREPAAWVAAHTQPGDRILVWGDFATFYVLADRLPASRFVGFLRGLERDRDVSPELGWDTGPEVWPLLAADLRAHPPAVVLDTSSGDYTFEHYPITRFPQVAALLAGYHRVAVVGGVSMLVPR